MSNPRDYDHDDETCKNPEYQGDFICFKYISKISIKEPKKILTNISKRMI